LHSDAASGAIEVPNVCRTRSASSESSSEMYQTTTTTKNAAWPFVETRLKALDHCAFTQAHSTLAHATQGSETHQFVSIALPRRGVPQQ
jgi:hypothetical protein